MRCSNLLPLSVGRCKYTQSLKGWSAPASSPPLLRVLSLLNFCLFFTDFSDISFSLSPLKTLAGLSQSSWGFGVDVLYSTGNTVHVCCDRLISCQRPELAVHRSASRCLQTPPPRLPRLWRTDDVTFLKWVTNTAHSFHFQSLKKTLCFCCLSGICGLLRKIQIIARLVRLGVLIAAVLVPHEEMQSLSF